MGINIVTKTKTIFYLIPELEGKNAASMAPTQRSSTPSKKTRKPLDLQAKLQIIKQIHQGATVSGPVCLWQ